MRPCCFADVEWHILEEHKEIRARIHALLMNAERVELPWARRALRVLLLRFASQFEAHLAYEERELAPRIRDLDAWGAVREAALLSEHRQQRRQLEEVCALAEDPTGAEEKLFEAVSTLAEDLLEDIVREERFIAELVRIDQDGYVDQMTG